jgi:hypothetical protein
VKGSILAQRYAMNPNDEVLWTPMN